jgi:polysaccharide export outer membrane protein
MATPRPNSALPPDRPPHELKKVNLPPYTIEPPDVLLIDAVSVVPRPPYRIAPLDFLFIQSTRSYPNEPIAGLFGVEPEGRVNLGPSYGTVFVAGMTLEEAKAELEKKMQQIFKDARVAVSLAQSRALQQIRGEHLVGPDGSVTLGVYGSVAVTGMTLAEAKAAIEVHLGRVLLNPEISLSVSGYNSKVYYIVFDGGGYGQPMYRLPITGNETVLDALSQINGLPAVSSVKKIWVARPAPDDVAYCQVLPVDWQSITKGGSTATNYQILPGDRIHVKADDLISLDNSLAKIFSPLERIFGITLLGTETAKAIKFFNQGGGTSGGSGF